MSRTVRVSQEDPIKALLRPKHWRNEGKLNKQDFEAIQRDWEENVIPLLGKKFRDLKRILGKWEGL